MKLKCLGSGSSGNCYLLSTETETLILDCGIPVMEIKKGLDFDLSKVVAVICSHGHLDHSKSVKDFEYMGISVFKPYETEKRVMKFGSFTVQAFQVPHDDTDCYGFYIKCGNGHKILYATDFEYIPFSFAKLGISTLLIECNYQNKYVDKSANNRNHVLRGHAELQTTIGVVKDNVSDSLQNVILCHLSSNNANPEECKAEVQKVAKNANVYVAEKGLEVELGESGCPF